MNAARVRCVGTEGVPVGHELGRLDRVVDGLRDDQETHPKRGKQGLRERAHVDHPPRAIKQLQRLDRPTAEPELGVVVIFEDRGVVILGP